MRGRRERGGQLDAPAPGHPFVLDGFQVEAMATLDAGRSVLVAAPTGSGKTVVAEHAVALALAEGRRVFYTTPIKALSNQKFGDLVRRHGPERVGLLTGDNAINGDAPVVVMTTEVLRNMIYADSTRLDDLSWVILDEVHYLQDAYRGPVWEEVIIHAPAAVRLVCLSATVSNAAELAEWIALVRGSCDVVVENERPVRLEHHFMAAERGSERLHVIPTLVDGRPNPEGRRFEATVPRLGGRSGRPGRPRLRFAAPRRVDVVDELAERDLVPAIYFIFSRAACDDAVSACLNAGVRLTTPDERERIRAIAEEHVRHLSDADLDVLDHARWLAGLEAGVAAHHAGMVPPFKEAVEACFSDGLVKVVFATETLALGVNMPARTVVIEKLTKFNGERHEFLSAGEYTQLTGRAGRRGIDPIGHAVVLWNPFVSFEEVANLAASRSFSLRSAFRPTYNMAANLVRRYDEDDAAQLLNRSFAQYQADRSVVRLEQRLRERRAEVGRLREALPVPADQLADYRALRREAEQAGTPDQAERRAIETAMARLVPGTVIRLDRRRGEPGVVLTVGQRRSGGVRLRALTAERRLVLVRPEDFSERPVRLGTIELPQPYAPHDRHFQVDVARRLSRARLDGEAPQRGRRGRAAGGAGAPASTARAGRNEAAPVRRAASLWRLVEEHPLSARSTPAELEGMQRAGARIERIEREIADLSRRVDGVADTVAHRFERLVGLLSRWGYLEGWSLTPRGQLLARCYHECDLLVVEALARGLLDGLDPAAFAALVSCFSYEHRSRTMPQQSWLPSAGTREAYQQIQALAARLNDEEERELLTLTRPPDATFAGLAYAWASGGALDDVLADEELSGGDFVRNVKQLIDLCRQLGDLAPEPDTAAAARRAAELLYRGVIAASSVVDVPDDSAEGEDADTQGVDGAAGESPAVPLDRTPGSGAVAARVATPGVTIERGHDWGRPAALPAGAPSVHSDRELAALLTAARARNDAAPEARLLGGDLWRTLGGSPGPRRAGLVGPDADTVRVPLDAVRARLDGVEHPYVAHLVARSWGWRGRFLLAMNAEWLGEWKVAPRAHPGDGLLDVLDGSLPLRQRLQARRRARFGDHLPHPAIRTCRVSSLSVTFQHPKGVWLDGRFVARCRSLELAVEPDALVAYV